MSGDRTVGARRGDRPRISVNRIPGNLSGRPNPGDDRAHTRPAKAGCARPRLRAVRSPDPDRSQLFCRRFPDTCRIGAQETSVTGGPAMLFVRSASRAQSSCICANPLGTGLPTLVASGYPSPAPSVAQISGLRRPVGLGRPRGSGRRAAPRRRTGAPWRTRGTTSTDEP